MTAAANNRCSCNHNKSSSEEEQSLYQDRDAAMTGGDCQRRMLPLLLAPATRSCACVADPGSCDSQAAAAGDDGDAAATVAGVRRRQQSERSALGSSELEPVTENAVQTTCQSSRS